MAESRQEEIRGAFARWNSGDPDVVFELFDDGIVLHSAMTSSTFRGHDGIRAWLAEIYEQFERWDVDLAGVEGVDDKPHLLLAFGTIKAHGRLSGMDIDLPIAWLARYRGEKVAELHMFTDADEARHAARAHP